ncbi:glycoside hydrolase family 16 protein [Nocardioides terrisoli]|uniref:glycoside hydrolase family 16 protein n=1 Tax=Nocardioides terrisoli TaxID=3388267 RepID=UPI00287B9FC9|nr:glycoside hydrolase family 16 protein [Nocardioides marmorisolisilvae]
MRIGSVRRWAVAGVVLLLAVLVVVVVSRDHRGSLSCGREALTKPDGKAWTCTFDDEFDGSSLRRSSWTVTTTSATGFHGGPECLVDRPGNVSVRDGSLLLTTRRTSAPFTCATNTGNYRSAYTSGAVSTRGIFEQTYGRFEIRARFPDAGGPGLYDGLWLYPSKLSYGRWPASGEIDLAEHYSVWPTVINHQLHYDRAVEDTRTPRRTCRISDPASFHTYVLLWTPSRITMAYDGQLCWTTTWRPAPPLRSPQPFDKPFYLVINQAVGIGVNRPDGLRLPATAAIDYVRVWR